MIYQIDDISDYYFYEIRELNGALLFIGNDKDHGSELWRTDGTTAGMYRVKDIYPGSYSGLHRDFRFFTVFKNRAYFITTLGTPNCGSELWSTDGTEAGTRLEADMIPGIPSSFPASMTPLGDCLLFSGTDTVQKKELFKLKPISSSSSAPHFEENPPLIWPNPAADYFYFEFENHTVFPIAIQLRNQLGQLVLRRADISGKQRVDCSGLQAGWYVVEFLLADRSVVRQNLVLDKAR